MRILVWHVHGGWMDSFVRGGHDCLLPTGEPERGGGIGRGGRDWPATAVEVPFAELRDAEVDAVVLQRPVELNHVERLLGRRPGRDLPAVFVEHNTPKGEVPSTVHPLADQSAVPIVHVTHFNALMWDSGRAPSLVVEHGVPDPGPLYTGSLDRIGVVVNEPVRRGRVTGTDLLPAFAAVAPLDVYGMKTDALPGALGLADGLVTAAGDLPTALLHPALAERRLYLHPNRWTSLGLSLLEAMHLGMPVVALAATEVPRAVPPEAGAVSSDVAELVAAARLLVTDPDEARRRGRIAREFALEHHGLSTFLDRWDGVLAELVRGRPTVGSTR
jgi:hypothetical protein